jgi:hypothetical protein
MTVQLLLDYASPDTEQLASPVRSRARWERHAKAARAAENSHAAAGHEAVLGEITAALDGRGA